MEFLERMAIAHAQHTYMNPIGEDGVAELIGALSLVDGTTVLDIACGGGALLRQLGQQAALDATGVDNWAFAIERARAATAGLPGTYTFHQVDGADYRPDAPVDIVCLVGASWIWGGYAGTLDALLERVRPGGLILLGEPYWRRLPDPEYLAGEEVTADTFTTLGGLHAAFVARDLRLVRLRGSTEAEWDHYEMLQAQAVDRWAVDNPDHPERDAVLAWRRDANARYLRWGRDTLGYAQFVLRAPTA